MRAGVICASVALVALVSVACLRRPIGEEVSRSERGGTHTTAARSRQALATEEPAGNLETVALFDGAMPTGVTVSQTGRVFVTFPRWGDDVPYTVAEVKNHAHFAYPDAEINRVPSADRLDQGFVSAQSVLVDAKDRLWVLDTGSVQMGTTKEGGPKLVGIDLATDKVFKTIVFPSSVALPTTYLNDVRIDLTRSTGGVAYITDSSGSGPNGIIVVDLDSGKSWRKLEGHPSTKADPSFVPIVEGRVLAEREVGQAPKPFAIGADGLTLSNDGRTLYYCPLSSRHLYSVPTDLLANEATPDGTVGRAVKDLGEKGASDGLESDLEGRVYVTSYESNAILRRNADGTFETLVVDPRVLWPDTLSLASAGERAGDGGYLYFVANQLQRQPRFHAGRDLRHKPYVLFRVKVDGARIVLKK
jgi:sugar lactone lactonase YvrE